MMAKFSTLEGHTHQGDQGGSPFVEFQSPRKPQGSLQPASLDGGGRPTQQGLQPPHIPPTGIPGFLPNTHHLMDKPTPRTFGTVQLCDPHVEDPDRSKRGKPRASQNRRPATGPVHATRSPAHGIDKVFPNAPGAGRKSHRVAGRAQLTGKHPSQGAALDERACRRRHLRASGS